MRKDIAGPETESTMPMWEGLKGVVREKAREFIQQILEEEVTELLGREKSERKAAVDAAPGYRNGYGKARRLSMSSGTITVRRPRVRGLEERFESRVLPLFAVAGGAGPHGPVAEHGLCAAGARALPPAGLAGRSRGRLARGRGGRVDARADRGEPV